MKKPRLRLETDAAAVLRFLDDNTIYHEWTPDDLNEDVLKVRVEIDDEPVAYLWGCWIDLETIYFHGCSVRRAWLSQATYDRLMDICRFFSIRRLVCEPIGPTAPAIRHLLKRRGFTEAGPELKLTIETDGQEEAEDSEGPQTDPSDPARPRCGSA